MPVSQAPRKVRVHTLLSLLLALLLAPLGPTQAEEHRLRALAHDSPQAFRAVGRLEIPTSRIEEGRRRHYRETCSGTLLAPGGARQAEYVLTAWHCLEYYTDLSRDLRFGARAGDGTVHWRRARTLADGGGMAADWALLQLRPGLPLAGGFMTASLAERLPPPEARLAMAGFSAAEADPGGRQPLRYDASCGQTGLDGRDVLTDCAARKGASGGGVFLDGALIGIISRGDSAGRSIFVPAARLRGPLRSLLP